jgi:hypothetical protein
MCAYKFGLFLLTFSFGVLREDLPIPSNGSWIFFWFGTSYEESYDAWFVAFLWIIFALGKIGRPEPGWIDRAGRIVGWGWISWGVIGQIIFRYLPQ